MKNRAPLIGVLVAVLLAAGYWFGLYKPALDEQSALEDETAELEREQQSLRSEIAQLEQVRDDEVSIRAALSRLEEYVPTGITQPQVVRQLHQTAEAAGVEIVSLSFGEPTIVERAPETGDPNTTLASIAISMVLEGGYFPTVDFLRRVEQDVPRAVLTQGVNVAEGEREFPSLSTTLAGQLFAVVPTSSTVPSDDPSAQPGGEDEPDAETGESGEDDEDTEPAEPADTDTGPTATARGEGGTL